MECQGDTVLVGSFNMGMEDNLNTALVGSLNTAIVGSLNVASVVDSVYIAVAKVLNTTSL